jgi:hypothetical protein
MLAELLCNSQFAQRFQQALILIFRTRREAHKFRQAKRGAIAHLNSTAQQRPPEGISLTHPQQKIVNR